MQAAFLSPLVSQSLSVDPTIDQFFVTDLRFDPMLLTFLATLVRGESVTLTRQNFVVISSLSESLGNRELHSQPCESPGEIGDSCGELPWIWRSSRILHFEAPHCRAELTSSIERLGPGVCIPAICIFQALRDFLACVPLEQQGFDDCFKSGMETRAVMPSPPHSGVLM